MRERLLASVHAKDNLARKKFQAQMALESKHAQFQLESAKNGKDAKGSGVNGKPKVSKNGTASLINEDRPQHNISNKKERLKEMLMWALMENPNHSKQALSAHVGASPGTIRKYLEELQDEGKVRPTSKTRSGYLVVEGSGTMMN